MESWLGTGDRCMAPCLPPPGVMTSPRDSAPQLTQKIEATQNNARRQRECEIAFLQQPLREIVTEKMTK